jgi:hypothetical protein
MSRRIAHRARYRNMRQFPLFFPRSRHDYRWIYQRQTPLYVKHALGYRLSLIPIDFRLVRSAYV